MNDESPKEIEQRERIAELAAKARIKIENEIRKSRKLIDNLNGELEKHGDADRWKRCGDLLLANSNNATRKGDLILVTDYFDENAPLLAIEGESNLSLSQIAESYFRRYTKARNGKRVIAERIAAAEVAITQSRSKISVIEKAVAELDEETLASFTRPRQLIKTKPPKKKDKIEFKGARRFASSDGIEILVGKKAKDNDLLTFRVAKSLDTWLHAADYPGSHVIIRGQGRNPVPDRTLVEAAELAAFYSDARDHPKAAVRYTQRKFVSKPKRAVPGLVSLASFKTILVDPKVGVEMLRDDER